jgi:hypothetical protein
VFLASSISENQKAVDFSNPAFSNPAFSEKAQNNPLKNVTFCWAWLLL